MKMFWLLWHLLLVVLRWILWHSSRWIRWRTHHVRMTILWMKLLTIVGIVHLVLLRWILARIISHKLLLWNSMWRRILLLLILLCILRWWSLLYQRHIIYFSLTLCTNLHLLILLYALLLCFQQLIFHTFFSSHLFPFNNFVLRQLLSGFINFSLLFIIFHLFKSHFLLSFHLFIFDNS